MARDIASLLSGLVLLLGAVPGSAQSNQIIDVQGARLEIARMSFTRVVVLGAGVLYQGSADIENSTSAPVFAPVYLTLENPQDGNQMVDADGVSADDDSVQVKVYDPIGKVLRPGERVSLEFQLFRFGGSTPSARDVQLGAFAQTTALGNFGVWPQQVDASATKKVAELQFSLALQNPGDEAVAVSVRVGRTPIVELNDKGTDGDERSGDGQYGAKFEFDYGNATPGSCVTFSARVEFLASGKLVQAGTVRTCVTALPIGIATVDLRELGKVNDIRYKNPDTGVSEPVVPNEVLARFNPSFNEAESGQTLASLAKSLGFSLAGVLPGADGSPGYAQLVLDEAATSGADLDVKINRLREHPAFKSLFADVQPHRFLRLAAWDPAKNPVHTSEQFTQSSLDAMRVREAWNISTAVGRSVWLIDTGGQVSHPDLNLSGATDPDSNGHGTMLSGVIAARPDNGIGIAGMAHGAVVTTRNYANVLCPGDASFLDFVCKNGTANAATEARVAAAVREAMNSPQWVINLAYYYATPYASTAAPPATPPVGAQLLCAEVAPLLASGRLLITAAGNEGNANYTYPAACPNSNPNRLISVGASAPESGGIWSGSTFGNFVDVSAPGENVITTQTGSGYAQPSGSSVASAHVSGAVALIWGISSVYLDNIKSYLVNSATPGTRQIDVLAAMQLANNPPVAVADSATVDEQGQVTIPVTGNDSDPEGSWTLVFPVDIVPGTPIPGTVVPDPTSGSIVFTHDGSEPTGPVQFWYEVYDIAGAKSNQALVTINVNALNDQPQIAVVTAPPAEVAEGDTVKVTVNVSDEEDGTPTVQWYLDGQPVSADGGSGGTMLTRSGLAAGTHEIEVRVIDSDGVQNSESFTVVVTAASEVPVPIWSLLLLLGVLLTIGASLRRRPGH
ncbi:MAG: S8 family serine peptidase [Gammaproteobacteria bacterium]|nr:S8 family serine peptidase [Gammaproteobacteria bacterium]